MKKWNKRELFVEVFAFLMVVSGVISGIILILMLAGLIISLTMGSYYSPLIFLAFSVFYLLTTSFWKKREFTLETGNWIERFLVKKAGASIDFIPFVTYKTLIGVALISIAPSLTNADSLFLTLIQIIVGVLFLPLIKYRFIFTEIGQFDVCYTIDPMTKKITTKWFEFTVNSVVVGLFGFAYFGILIATLQKTYEFTIVTLGNG